MRRPELLLLVLMPLTLSSASAQELLRTHYQTSNNYLGMIRTVGDLDGDGVLDYAIAGQLGVWGRIFLFSGSTGVSLGELATGVALDGFGSRYDAVGDFDGDGVPDIVAGAHNWSSPTTLYVGMVLVFSGATLEPIVRITGPQIQDHALGWLVWGLGDVNGDGFTDMASRAGIDPT